jgi:hypothetical protein
MFLNRNCVCKAKGAWSLEKCRFQKISKERVFILWKIIQVFFLKRTLKVPNAVLFTFSPDSYREEQKRAIC